MEEAARRWWASRIVVADGPLIAPDGSVDAVRACAAVSEALAAVVAYDEQHRHGEPPPWLCAHGLSVVITQWVRQAPLDPMTEWPAPWGQLYAALQALPRPEHLP